MINNLEEKQFIEKRINKLENILFDLKEKLLPEREEQYKAMAAVYVRKIIELREEIEKYIGMDNVLIEHDDINIHMVGPSIGYGKIPIRLFSDYLDNLRMSVKRNYGIIYNKKKVPKDICLLTDFTLNQVAKGSVNISLSIPTEQCTFFDDMKLTESLNIYFKLLKNISAGESINDIITSNKIDNDKLVRLLQNILKIMPDDKNIKNIDISGRVIGNENKIYLNHESKKNILKKISDINLEEKNISITGVIREVDLDKLTFLLREVETSEKTNQIKCFIVNDEIENLGEYLNSKVKVAGVLDGNKIVVKYIDKIKG